MKRFGFPIHGAIDGYSRKILWLEIVRSNNDPRSTSLLYLHCTALHDGCPVLLRTDCGTENGDMAAMQCFFRRNGSDSYSGLKSHKYGSSHANQRIEGWWSFFRRRKSEFWIDYFKGLVDSGKIDLGKKLHMEFLWFCFNRVLQKELNDTKEHWNTHRIRKSGFSAVHGVPNVIFDLPERWGGENCLQEVPTAEVHQMLATVDYHQESIDEDVADIQSYIEHITENQAIAIPQTFVEAVDLLDYFLYLCDE